MNSGGNSTPYLVDEMTGKITLLDEVRALIIEMCFKGASKTAIADELGVGVRRYGIKYINDLLERKHLEKRKKGKFIRYYTTPAGRNWLVNLPEPK